MFGFGCGNSVEISLLKVTVCGVASLLRADSSIFSAAQSLLRADLLLLRAEVTKTKEKRG